MPLKVSKRAHVRYVDRMSVVEFAGIIRSSPTATSWMSMSSMMGSRCPPSRRSRRTSSANHFLEHTQDPVGTLRSHLRVLRPRGVLYMAIPDKRKTFDHDRPLTSLEHVLRDFHEGPEWSKSAHFDEWAEKVSVVLNDLRPEDPPRRLAILRQMTTRFTSTCGRPRRCARCSCIAARSLASSSSLRPCSVTPMSSSWCYASQDHRTSPLDNGFAIGATTPAIPIGNPEPSLRLWVLPIMGRKLLRASERVTRGRQSRRCVSYGLDPPLLLSRHQHRMNPATRRGNPGWSGG